MNEFVARNGIISLNNSTVSGSLTVTNGITGSIAGTASWAFNAVSASQALTASSAPGYLPLTGGTINGNITVNGTASIGFLNVQYQTSSVLYSSGSNQLGDALSDIQTLFGTTSISGSLRVSSSADSWIIGNSNLGVGTSSPGLYKLNVAGNISLSGAAQYIDFQNGDLRLVNTGGLFSLQTYSVSTGLTTKMAVTGVGNVGIGTTAPTAKLEVIGNIAAYSSSAAGTGSVSVNADTNSSFFIANNTGGYLRIGRDTSTGLLYGVPYASVIVANNSYPLLIGTNDTIRVAIGATGNFGIGMSNPTSKLDVLGSAAISGSLTVTGSVTAPSFVGTASWASNSISSSYALSASQAQNTVSASYALSASQAQNSVSASYALNATSASYALSSSQSQNSVSSSYALNATSASYALSSSQSQNSVTASYALNAVSASFASTASNVQGGSAGYVTLWDTNTRLSSSVLYQNAGNIGIGTTSPSAKLDNRGGILRTNTRSNNAQRYPIGHYTPGECVFEINPTWTQEELQAYFNTTNVTWTASADAPGGYSIYINGAVSVGGVYDSGFPYIPVDTNDVYYMECWIQNVGTGQTHYMGSIDYNESFGSLGGNPGSYGYWVMASTNPGNTWTKVSGYITGFGTSTGQFVAGTKYWTPQALFNYGAGTGTRACRISGWKVIRVYQAGNRYFSGSVGIGNIAASSYRLDVNGNIRGRAAYGGGFFGVDDGATRIFSITRETSVAANEMYLLSYGPIAMGVNRTTGVLTNPDVYINTSGNLGLGTTAPTAKLHVIGNTLISGSLTVTGSVTAPSFVGTASWASNAVYAISANSAVIATATMGTSGQLLSKDDRIIEPNSITNAYLQFGFTAWNNNNAGPYADYLHMRSYIDGSGGNDNLIAFNKQQIGMRIWQQSFNSATAYADYRDVVLTSGSSTGYVPLWNGPYAISSSVIYQSGSNIGLGTITPTQRLEVSGNIKLTAGGFLYGDGSSAFLQLTNANGSKLAYGSNVYFEALAASANIRASSENITLFNNNGRIVLSGSGDVGIGTNNPGARLDVSGSAIVSGTLTIAPSNAIEFQVASTGVKIGNTIADSHNVTGSLNTSGSMTLLGTFTQTPFKSIVIPSLAASATQAREFEILRGITDFNDWSSTGVVEIEVHESSWGRGLKKKYAFSYGYYDSAEFKLVEMIGASTYNNFQLRMGSKTLISGDVYYYPIYAQVRNYASIDIQIKTRRNITTNPVSTTNGDLYVNTAPTASNITDFTADSIVTLNNAASGVDVTGSLGVSGTATVQNLAVNGTSATFNTTNTNINSSNVVVGNDTGDLVGIAGNTVYVSGSRVGIGTTSPAYTLDTNGDGRFQGTLYTRSGTNVGIQMSNTSAIRNSGTQYFDFGQGGSGDFYLRGGSGLGSYFTILNAGNVGIGTTSPQRLLHIQSANGTASQIQLGQTSQRDYYIGIPASQTYFDIYDASAGASRLAITSGGNVGIGTTSATSFLHILGDQAAQLRVQGNGSNGGNINIDASNGYSMLNLQNGASTKWTIRNDGSNNRLSFLINGSGGTEAVTVLSSGNVGIGTTSPNAKLDVSGNAIITGSLTVGTSSLGSTENTIVVGPPPAGGTGEGGQILLQAAGGSYTSASMIDTYQNRFRILRGTNASSDAEYFNLSLHSGQLGFSKYTGSGAFPGTAVANLAVDSGGNVITVATGGGGGSVTINNNTDNYLITATGTANTLNGEANLQFDGSTLTVTGNLTAAPGSNTELQVTSTGVKVGNAVTDSHNVTGSLNIQTGSFITLAHTSSGVIKLQDASVWVNSANYVNPQIRLRDYQTGMTLVNNDEVHIVTNATATAGFKLSAGIPKMTLDSSAWLQWSTAGTNGFTHDVILKREAASTLAITGSVKVSNGVTGSLLGTASWAVSASWAPSAGGSAPTAVTFNRVTGNYTLALSDAGKTIEMNASAAGTYNITVPPASTTNFADGTFVDVILYGSGSIQFVTGSGVTFRSANNWTKLGTRYGAATLINIAGDEWYLVGNLNP